MSAISNPLTNRPNIRTGNSARTGGRKGEPQYSQFGFWLTLPRRPFSLNFAGSEQIEQVIQQVPQGQISPVEIAQVEIRNEPVHAQPAVSPDVQWLRDHAGILGNYRGEWLLICEGELLAHDQNFAVIRAAIHESGIQSPFVYYVPLEEESNFLIL
jgi:hypothetical protein